MPNSRPHRSRPGADLVTPPSPEGAQWRLQCFQGSAHDCSTIEQSPRAVLISGVAWTGWRSACIAGAFVQSLNKSTAALDRVCDASALGTVGGLAIGLTGSVTPRRGVPQWPICSTVEQIRPLERWRGKTRAPLCQAHGFERFVQRLNKSGSTLTGRAKTFEPAASPAGETHNDFRGNGPEQRGSDADCSTVEQIGAAPIVLSKPTAAVGGWAALPYPAQTAASHSSAPYRRLNDGSIDFIESNDQSNVCSNVEQTPAGVRRAVRDTAIFSRTRAQPFAGGRTSLDDYRPIRRANARGDIAKQQRWLATRRIELDGCVTRGVLVARWTGHHRRTCGNEERASA